MEAGYRRGKKEGMGKEREGVLLPGKYHKGEEEREFKLTNGQIRAKRLRKQERPNDSEKKTKGHISII